MDGDVVTQLPRSATQELSLVVRHPALGGSGQGNRGLECENQTEEVAADLGPGSVSFV